MSEADDAAAAAAAVVGARLKVVVALTVYPTGPEIHIIQDICVIIRVYFHCLLLLASSSHCTTKQSLCCRKVSVIFYYCRNYYYYHYPCYRILEEVCESFYDRVNPWAGTAWINAG